MVTPRQYRFLRAQVLVTLVGLVGLATVGALTVEFVFVVAFLGFVVLTALTGPVHVVPEWRRRLRWPLLAGAVVFVALVVQRTIAQLLASL